MPEECGQPTEQCPGRGGNFASELLYGKDEEGKDQNEVMGNLGIKE